MEHGHAIWLLALAPEAGFEPATIALTGRRSTIELLRNTWLIIDVNYSVVND